MDIYNNRIYRWFKREEEQSFERDNQRNGLGITDPEKARKAIELAAKSGYLMLLFVLFSCALVFIIGIIRS